MSISDLLDQIEIDAQACLADRPADPSAVELAMKTPALVTALRAVLDLHRPMTRYLAPHDYEWSYSTRKEAAEEAECDPSEVTEWVLCSECHRVESGPGGDDPFESGYECCDYPCPTVRAATHEPEGGAA